MDKNWTEVTSTSSEIWDKQKPIEGLYKNRREGVGPNESMFYMIKTKEGDVGIWGSTVLDTKFAEITIGDEIRIEPLGLQKSPKTGRQYMDFKVMYRPAVFKAVGEFNEPLPEFPGDA